MFANYLGGARAHLLAACFVSSWSAAGLVWGQDTAPTEAQPEIQPATSASESMPLAIFGWDAEPIAAAATVQPAEQAPATTHESSVAQELLAPQDTPAVVAPNASAEATASPPTTTGESMPEMAVVVPNSEGAVEAVVAEPAKVEPSVAKSVAADESASPVPAAEIQASVPAAGTQLPDTLGGEPSPSVNPIAIEVTAIKTPQAPDAQVVPASESAAIGAAESTNAPAP